MNINEFKGETLPQVNAARNNKAQSDDFAKVQGIDNFARLIEKPANVEKPSNDESYKETSSEKIEEKPQEVSKDKDADNTSETEDEKSKDNAKPENGIILALIFPNQTTAPQAVNGTENTKNGNSEIAIDANAQSTKIAQEAQANANGANVDGQILTGDAAQKFEAALKKIGNAQPQETETKGKTNKQSANNVSQTQPNETTNEASDTKSEAISIEFDGQNNTEANNSKPDSIIGGEKKETTITKDDKLANNVESLKQGPKAENFEKWASEVNSKDEPKLQINNLQAIAATMVKKFQNGDKKFFVRLDPPELGKIEVELKISADNKVSAILKTENPQALNELMKGARDLVNSLNQAGFDLTENDLTFSLNSNGNQNPNSQNPQAEEKSMGKIINLQNQKEEVQPEIANTKSKKIRHEIWDRARVSMVV